METYKYLIKVEPWLNNNKFYEMKQTDSNTFTVTWGRVGNSGVSATYPNSKWNTKYNEKINKGYADITANVASLVINAAATTNNGSAKSDNLFFGITSNSVTTFIKNLLSFVNKSIKDNYSVTDAGVTQVMIDNAQKEIDKLYSFTVKTPVYTFNKVLLNLFKIIPRKMKNVNDILNKTSPELYSKIIQAEQDLLDVMAAKVIENEKNEKSNQTIDSNSKNILEINGLSITDIDDNDKQIILKNLQGESNKFKNAWKVINNKTEENFQKYVTKNNIKNIKSLWHGSRNENWWSIICSGLVLRPNAVITGKMFGHGIYFADKAKKAVGYTSLSGSYWAKGQSTSAFLSLYDIALGNEYEITKRESSHGNLTSTSLSKLGNFHSVFAKGGFDLINNEYIVYNEAQTTIRYIVEISK